MTALRCAAARLILYKVVKRVIVHLMTCLKIPEASMPLIPTRNTRLLLLEEQFFNSMFDTFDLACDGLVGDQAGEDVNALREERRLEWRRW